jgi:hypothetical protein
MVVWIGGVKIRIIPADALADPDDPPPGNPIDAVIAPVQAMREPPLRRRIDAEIELLGGEFRAGQPRAALTELGREDLPVGCQDAVDFAQRLFILPAQLVVIVRPAGVAAEFAVGAPAQRRATSDASSFHGPSLFHKDKASSDREKTRLKDLPILGKSGENPIFSEARLPVYKRFYPFSGWLSPSSSIYFASQTINTQAL